MVGDVLLRLKHLISSEEAQYSGWMVFTPSGRGWGGEAYKLHLSLSIILDSYSKGCLEITGRIFDIEESLVRLLWLAIFLGCD